MRSSENPAFIQVIQDRSKDNQPVTAILSQQVKSNHEADYEQWIKEISAVAQLFPGHQGVTVIRPEAGICPEYVIVLKFDCYTHLKRWLDSDERRHWLEKAKPLIAKTQDIQILTGLETWFTLRNQHHKAPPRYKMALLTTVAVFVAVNLINPLLLPLLAGIPKLLSSLIISHLVVLLLTYGIMPRLTKVFYPWLYPTKDVV